MADGNGEGLPSGRAAKARGYVIYSEAIGAEICERVAAGESIAAICRGSGMPNRTTVRDWAVAMPVFHQALAKALRAARTTERVADRRRGAARALVGRDNRGLWTTYTPQLGEAICRRIADGETLASIGRDPDMPSASTVLRWVTANPAFEADYVAARAMSADVLFDEAREVALGSTHETVWSDRLAFDVIRWQTARLAPRKYCERLVVADGLATVADEQAEAGRRPLEIQLVNFSRAPNGQVLTAPPRNEKEEQAWVDAYGKPYDGPV